MKDFFQVYIIIFKYIYDVYINLFFKIMPYSYILCLFYSLHCTTVLTDVNQLPLALLLHIIL